MTKVKFCTTVLFIVALFLWLGARYHFFYGRYEVHKKGGVIISGASRGIGFYTAAHLANEGYTVFAGVRSDQDYELLLKEESGGRNLLPVILDVTDQHTIDECFGFVSKELEKRNLKLTAVINNAGVQHLRVLECLDEKTLRWLFDVNVFGAMALTQRFLPMLRSSKGRVVAVGSVAGFAAVPLYGGYAATKHALEALVDTLRQELKESGVSVSLIQAGSINTDMANRYVEGDARKKNYADQTGISSDHSSECQEAYPEILDGVDDFFRVKAARSWPVETVARAIHHSISSQYPRARYCIAGVDGLPCWLIRFLYSVLPEIFIDGITGSGSKKNGTLRKIEASFLNMMDQINVFNEQPPSHYDYGDDDGSISSSNSNNDGSTDDL